MTDVERPAAANSGTLSHTGSFEEISKLVRDAGLMDVRPGYYTYKITVNALLLIGSWALFVVVGDSWWQMAVAVLLAFVTTQTDLIGHDAGHRQLFRTKRGNEVVGYIHGNVLSGVSFGWWVGHHTQHHNYPNHLSKDPDILRRQVIFTAKHRDRRTGALARFIVRHQAWMFYITIMMEGLRLHLSGFIAARRGALKRYKKTELTVLTLHLAVYLVAVFWVMSPVKGVLFILIHQALFGLYMGLLFAPNHKGLPVRDGDKEEWDWLTRQVVTSRNLMPNRITHFLYGGLNYQIEHHLFPSMPRSNLRRAHPLVKDYCLRNGLPYVECTMLKSYLEVSDYLAEVSEDVRRLENPRVAAQGAQ
ncbi:fatty acid desaturase [Wenjunlia vitaminophila]|uniref:Fatty acid desaturase n=1 Tax=Wenjunlia vitaminophila TaxID=76728 RepID=A0A0T6LKC3_WENVI|nr:acyl-CoA desaturase [Wenjunlia vitaminophila]KRV46506.1 fatty acid desaturase [Wenjunlia vitaminophila]